MQEITLKAAAKINLGLDVVRRRPDGYHDLRMIMQTVSLYDRIKLTVTRSSGVRLKTNLGYLPTDRDNHAYLAAQMLIGEFGIEQGVFIDLQKKIPVAAGLAGGSADAAAVLIGMNELFSLGLTQEMLMERGLRIGADVPYCILKGTALAEGIGEKLTALPPMPDCHIVIAKPAVRVSTKQVYMSLHLDEKTVHPDIDAQADAIRAGDLRGICAQFGNVLEDVTGSIHPEIDRLKMMMKSEGALNALMSGSGPSVFGIFEDSGAARECCTRIKREFEASQAFTARPV